MFKLSKRSGIIFKMAICLSQHNTCLNTEYSSRQEIKGKNSFFSGKIFQADSLLASSPKIDIFASLIGHELTQYIA